MTEENVRVVVRVRPLSTKEVEKGCKSIAKVDPTGRRIDVVNPVDSKKLTFCFDALFQDAEQAEIYNQIARPLVQNVLEGYNATIFAYGQTGTGKTYTMEGEPTPEKKGIIPNSFAQIFTSISKAPPETRFLVRVSHLEIYNEEVRDLLSKDHEKKLDLKEASDRGVYVKDLSSFVVRNAADMDRIMELGNRNRSVASTNMNATSSRSHAIFTITVECSTEVGNSVKGRSIRMGKLNLVDLAGSERLSKTGATGKRLKEATKINWSLSNLGNVISALVEGSSHVPYRNSKLTRLLQDSLGGNAKTVMCANVGPADYNYEETINTLRYAHRAKSIKNHASINEDPKDALLRQFETEIEKLRRQLEEQGTDGDPADPDSLTPGSGDDDEDDEETEFLSGNVTEFLNPVPPEALTGIKGELETQEKISSSIGEVAKHRRQALNALKDQVQTWKQQEQQKASLQDRYKSIRKKILVGGENLLDKSQQQEQLLQHSMQELEQKKEEEKQLTSKLETQQAETAEAEEKIMGLQEQTNSLNKKLKKVWNQYHVVKTELEQVRQEYQTENAYIPGPYQTLIEDNCSWSEDVGDWSLNCIAYAGNNIQRFNAEDDETELKKQLQSVDLSNVYIKPEIDEQQAEPILPATGRADERPSTRGSGKIPRRQQAVQNCRW
ncbi:unnamed protein product [Allacma fusca]|uniref:Kinesin-like protein n=1 Tax=Allacma fusca TaxID=39272 RepID=A0A8J2PWB0_9HEXA|nr:unnamed protein product [Allacma fusca]